MRDIKASIIIFLFDVLAMLAAFLVSGICAYFISGMFSGNMSSEHFLFGSSKRISKFTLMSLAVLFACYNKGHYSRRIPWWNQVRFLLIALTIALCADGFFFFAMKYQFSRVWTGLSWAVAFVLLLFAALFQSMYATGCAYGKCRLL